MSIFEQATPEFSLGSQVYVNPWQPECVFLVGECAICYRGADGSLRLNPARVLRSPGEVVRALTNEGIDAEIADTLVNRGRSAIRAEFERVDVEGGVVVSIKGHGVRITRATWHEGALDVATTRGLPVDGVRQSLLDAAMETAANRASTFEWEPTS